jgi:hypothetical protein
MDYTSFSHGQVLSKIWLCEQLEPHVPKNTRAAIVGSWYNVLAFMMLTRKSELYQYILGIDIDPLAIDTADRICDAWRIGCDKKVSNIVQDARTFDYTEFNLVVNCSVEHMSSDWFNNIPEKTIVCIQSSNVTDTAYPWYISNPNPDQETLAKKYPLSQTLFSGEKEFDYGSWGYKRFMLIGVK